MSSRAPTPGRSHDRPGRQRGSRPRTARKAAGRSVTRLHVHAWGDEGAPAVVCLHGVTGWGGHFAGLASSLAGRHRLLAPDLLGHGSSTREPPWRLDDHSTPSSVRSETRRSGSGTRSAHGSPSSTRPAIPAPSSGSCCSTRRSSSRRTSPSGRPRTPAPSGRTPRSRMRSTAATRRASSMPRRASWWRASSAPPGRGGRRVAVPVHAGVRRHRLLGARDRAAAVRRRPSANAARARRRVVPPLRPPARRPSRRARRPASGRDRPGGHTVLWDAHEETADAVARFLAGAPD